MFLTLVSVDICLWIFPISVLENIDQPKKYSTLDSNTSEQIHNIYIYELDAVFWNSARLGGSTQDPADPGLELGRVDEKIA